MTSYTPSLENKSSHYSTLWDTKVPPSFCHNFIKYLLKNEHGTEKPSTVPHEQCGWLKARVLAKGGFFEHRIWLWLQ